MKNYYLGLDMGTNSVGWAVTDEQYRLSRFKGKDMWGIREFEEAQTAAERRSHRTARRRNQRNAVRMGLIRDYFANEIEKIDPLFFIRLDNSKYFTDDKDEKVRYKNGIFNDLNYTDKEYYEEFPTVFHLRKSLIEYAKPHDVRLVYLAVSNIFKHRGNFLHAGLGTDSAERSFEELYPALYNAAEQLDISLEKNVDIKNLEKILCDRNCAKTGRAENLCLLLNIAKTDKSAKAIVKGLCGLSVKVQDIYCDSENGQNEEENKMSICFADGSFEEKEEELRSKYGEDLNELIFVMKEIYDKSVLAKIMAGCAYLSEARVVAYDKHKQDLLILKKVWKKYFSDAEYDDFFRSDKNGTYSAYVNSTNAGKKDRRNFKGRRREDLYKTIKDLFKKLAAEEDDNVRYIREEMDKETFLPKQLTSDNGVIPYQVHEKELKAILTNAEKYLSFLSKRDETGLSVSEKILQLFAFRIPYYIGPVSKDSNGWVIRNANEEKGPVLPWNIEQKINMKATSEAL